MPWLYDQRRFEVPSEKISNNMKLAIVSIEDRRFPDHKGVDWQGTLRAFLTNTTTGEVQQGASTLDQQYVKNYQLLVVAKTDAERRAAIETTPARKIREIRMALTLDKELTKDEILTRYLNLVPFGNGSFGIQDAAQTYFGRRRRRSDRSAVRDAGRHGSVQLRAEPVHERRGRDRAS